MYLVCVHCTQGDTGLIAVEVDGRKENPLITALGDNWRRRRHIMTPAFSTHKMRLVRWEVDTDVNEFGESWAWVNSSILQNALPPGCCVVQWYE